jgi:hypothetical protein
MFIWETFEDTKGGTKEHNGQKNKQRSTKHITQKTKDWATRTLLKPGVNSGAPEELAVPAPYMWNSYNQDFQL